MVERLPRYCETYKHFRTSRLFYCYQPQHPNPCQCSRCTLLRSSFCHSLLRILAHRLCPFPSTSLSQWSCSGRYEKSVAPFHLIESKTVRERVKPTHPENCAPTPISNSSCCDLSLGVGLPLPVVPDGLLWPRPLLACELGLYVAPTELPDVEGLCLTCQRQAAKRKCCKRVAHTCLIELYKTWVTVESRSDAWIE